MPRSSSATYTPFPMAALSILLLGTAITLALALIVGVVVVSRARLDAYVREAPLDSIRGALVLEIVSSASLVLAALGIARELGDAGSSPGPNALWAMVGLPASIGAVCVGVWGVRAPGSASPGEASRAHAPLWVASALVAGALVVLLILSGRLVLTDALLVLVAAPSWMWMVSEWRSRPGRTAAPAPDQRPSDVRSPGPLILLLTIPLAGLLVYVARDAPIPLIPDLLAAGALLALLLPLALVAAAPDLTPERADWTGAPIFLGATVAPLVGLAAATLAHVGVIVAHAASRTVQAGAAWHVGAAESLASMPYLSGLDRLITPALLALALPLLSIALAGVSHRVRRGAGVALILSGIAMGASALVST